MGACCGKVEAEPARTTATQNAIANRRATPNERTRLLDPEHLNVPEHDHSGSANGQSHKEKDALQAVVQRTTENLINIHGTEPGNRVSLSDSTERSAVYKRTLQNVRTKSPTSPIRGNKTRQKVSDLLGAAQLSGQNRELISNASQRLSSLVHSMALRDVGPIIQTLPEL